MSAWVGDIAAAGVHGGGVAGVAAAAAAAAEGGDGDCRSRSNPP